jgi:hypothetical protein
MQLWRKATCAASTWVPPAPSAALTSITRQYTAGVSAVHSCTFPAHADMLRTVCHALHSTLSWKWQQTRGYFGQRWHQHHHTLQGISSPCEAHSCTCSCLLCIGLPSGVVCKPCNLRAALSLCQTLHPIRTAAKGDRAQQLDFDGRILKCFRSLHLPHNVSVASSKLCVQGDPLLLSLVRRTRWQVTQT